MPLGPPIGQLDWLEALADRPTVVANRDGSGPGAQRGDLVTFDFVVIAVDGRELANSELRGLPYTMTVGEIGNDPLLDVSIRNMAVGAERELIFPVGTAYTEEGYPPFVPADTPLRVRVKMRALRSR